MHKYINISEEVKQIALRIKFCLCIYLTLYTIDHWLPFITSMPLACAVIAITNAKRHFSHMCIFKCSRAVIL